jgi:hypothetical protein
MKKLTLALICLFLIWSTALAGPFGIFGRRSGGCGNGSCVASGASSVTCTTEATKTGNYTCPCGAGCTCAPGGNDCGCGGTFNCSAGEEKPEKLDSGGWSDWDKCGWARHPASGYVCHKTLGLFKPASACDVSGGDCAADGCSGGSCGNSSGRRRIFGGRR